MQTTGNFPKSPAIQDKDHQKFDGDNIKPSVKLFYIYFYNHVVNVTYLYERATTIFCD